jgi:outer membrane protein assembly factor BamB
MKRQTLVAAAMTTAAVLGMSGAVTAGIGTQPGLAATQSSPWSQTNSNAALSRANLTEKVLSPAAATKVKYLRSAVAPPASLNVAACPWQAAAAAPVLAGGHLYAITAGKISKYNAATGSLIWRKTPNQSFDYESLAVSHNLVIAGGTFCNSASDQTGMVYAFNAATGALVWSAHSDAPVAEAVAAGSYVITVGEDVAADIILTVRNISDGTPAWSSVGCAGGALAVVVNSLVVSYGCSPQGSATLDARNLATGALAWSLPGDWWLQRGDQSGANGRHLYATDPTGTVVGLNPLTGQAEYPLSQAGTVLAVDNSRVYATCGSQGQDLCGYNSGTGALEWQDTKLIVTPKLAAEADGVLYLDYGSALNTATGKRITFLWANYISGTALAVGDGRIADVSGRIIDLYGLQGY